MTPAYYNNSIMSLYAYAEYHNFNPYYFDILKRLNRPFKLTLLSDIVKSINVLKDWKKENVFFKPPTLQAIYIDKCIDTLKKEKEFTKIYKDVSSLLSSSKNKDELHENINKSIVYLEDKIRAQELKFWLSVNGNYKNWVRENLGTTKKIDEMLNLFISVENGKIRHQFSTELFDNQFSCQINLLSYFNSNYNSK